MNVTVIGDDEFVKGPLCTTISESDNHVRYSHGVLSFGEDFTSYLSLLDLFSAHTRVFRV